MIRQPTLRTGAEGRTVAVVGDVYRFPARGEITLFVSDQRELLSKALTA